MCAVCDVFWCCCYRRTVPHIHTQFLTFRHFTNSIIQNGYNISVDPTNCSQYYLCAGPSQSSFVYECLNGYVYNSVDKSCKRKNSNADCSTINCAANPNRYVVYPGDRAYYAFCLNNGGISNPIMFRCADPENSEFIQATRKCVFQCKTEGRVADPKNCQLYYECYRIGSTYISRSQKCITGFIFDDTKKRCVAGTCPSSTTSPASPTSSTSAS